VTLWQRPDTAESGMRPDPGPPPIAASLWLRLVGMAWVASLLASVTAQEAGIHLGGLTGRTGQRGLLRR